MIKALGGDANTARWLYGGTKNFRPARGRGTAKI